MYNLISQISYPVFISGVFIFFILASIFSFIVGVGLATRSTRMLQFFNFMNRRVSTRQLMKPLTAPHFIEPTLLRHPEKLGVGITVGAVLAVCLLREMDPVVFQPLYSGNFPAQTTEVLAGYTHAFLLIGNSLCVALGAVLMFFPEKLAAIGRYTDKWLTFRKSTRSLHEPYIDVDKWVLANATVAGITLSVLSLGLGIWMYIRL